MFCLPFEDRAEKDQAMKDAKLFESLEIGEYQDVVDAIKYGASIDSVDPSGCLPIHYAAALDSPECLEYILQCNAKVDSRDYAGWTCLHIAAGDGNLDCVESLLKHNAAVDIKESAGGSTALHIAASRGRNKVVKRLLQSGADINAQDMLGFTPLCQAAVNEWAETCRLLLQHGAKVDQGNLVGRTPLHLAVTSGNLYAVKVLVEFPSALIRELKQKIVGIMCNKLKLMPRDVARLITEIAVPISNIETLDDKGRTALDIAEVRGLPEIADYLRKLMAPNAKNELVSCLC